MFETGAGYEKEKVTWQVDRWTSRRVNKLLVIGDKVTDGTENTGLIESAGPSVPCCSGLRGIAS